MDSSFIIYAAIYKTALEPELLLDDRINSSPQVRNSALNTAHFEYTDYHKHPTKPTVRIFAC